jgi:hypothetical protein
MQRRANPQHTTSDHSAEQAGLLSVACLGECAMRLPKQRVESLPQALHIHFNSADAQARHAGNALCWSGERERSASSHKVRRKQLTKLHFKVALLLALGIPSSVWTRESIGNDQALLVLEARLEHKPAVPGVNVVIGLLGARIVDNDAGVRPIAKGRPTRLISGVQATSAALTSAGPDTATSSKKCPHATVCRPSSPTARRSPSPSGRHRRAPSARFRVCARLMQSHSIARVRDAREEEAGVRTCRRAVVAVEGVAHVGEQICENRLADLLEDPHPRMRDGTCMQRLSKHTFCGPTTITLQRKSMRAAGR